MKRISAALCLLLLSACAGSPAPVLTAEPPPAGKSRLTVTRTTDFMYWGVAARVDVNGRRVGELGRGAALQHVIEPGPVTISTDAWSMPGRYTISVNAQSDTDYLLEISPRFDGGMMAGMFLGVIGQAMEGGGPFLLVVKETRPLR